MNPMLKAIKGRIKHREEHLRELKRLYRDPDHQPPKLATHAELRFQKFESTVDYAVTAASRGKVHRGSDDFISQLEFIEKNLREIELADLGNALDYGAYAHDAKTSGERPLPWNRWMGEKEVDSVTVTMKVEKPVEHIHLTLKLPEEAEAK